jgi:hypothetical protein
MTDTITLWRRAQIADALGVTMHAVRKWRRNTRAALKLAGQLDSHEPNCPLPTNALPVPTNQAEVVELGDDPRWDPEIVLRWADQTGRRDADKRVPKRPSPPGPPGKRS